MSSPEDSSRRPELPKELKSWSFAPALSPFKDKRPKEFMVSRRKRHMMADIREEDKVLSSDLSARDSTTSPTLVDESGPSGSEKRSSESEKERSAQFEKGRSSDSVKEHSAGEAPARTQIDPIWESNVSPVQPSRMRLFVTNPDPPESDDSTSALTSPRLESNMDFSSLRNINDDFDFSGRENPYKATRLTGIQRKLDKRKSSILHRRSSSSASLPLTADTPQPNASTSCDESSRDVSFRLDAIFGPRGHLSSTSSPTSPALPFFSSAFSAARPATATASATKDPLPTTHLSLFPDDRSTLEGLINIHLGKLDRYKRQVISFNLTIEQLYADHAKLIQSPEAQITPQLVTALEMEIEETRAGRNTKRRYVDFHRGELRAIAEKRIILDEELGMPPSLMQIYDWMETQNVWDQRFY